MNELAQESALLRERYRSSKDVREKERYQALYLYSADYSKKQIAEIVCRDEDTIKAWVDKWVSDKSIDDNPKGGRPPKIDESDRQKIRELIEENDPKKHGINASYWDCHELQRYFFLKGKGISDDAIRLVLKDMGAHYVKAEIEFAEADIKAQEKFARQFFKDLKNKRDSTVLLFHDEMSVSCSPKKGYGWTFEERLIIRAPQRGGRKRLNCFGAVNPLDGEIVQMTSKESKDTQFVKFLSKIERKYPRKKIRIYLDNLIVHKSWRVQEFLRKRQHMSLKFMPPYSPDLNPQEQWWNYQRSKFLNNRCFYSRHQLATALGGFVRKTQPEQIRSVCSLAPIEKLLS